MTAPVPADQEEVLARKAMNRARLEASSMMDLPDGRTRYEPGFPEQTLYGQLAAAIATLRAERDQLASELREARDLIQAYEEASANKHRLAREIDVAMHGEEGAAKQASLCDLVGPAAALRAEAVRLRAALEGILPSKLCGESWGLPDTERMPIQTTLGALTAARAALSDPRQSPAKGDDHHG